MTLLRSRLTKSHRVPPRSMLSKASPTSLVEVDDENDNAPEIRFPPAPPRNVVQLSSRAPPGALVARVDARDVDAGVNARLTHRIASGNEGGMFAMDPLTGVVTTVRRLGAVLEGR